MAWLYRASTEDMYDEFEPRDDDSEGDGDDEMFSGDPFEDEEFDGIGADDADGLPL